MKTYASGCARCKTKDGFSLRFCIDFPIETAWWFLSQQSSTSKSSSSSSFWSQTMLKHARIIYGIVSFDPAHSDSLKMNTCSWAARNLSTVEIVASKTSVQVCLHMIRWMYSGRKFVTNLTTECQNSKRGCQNGSRVA